jgi:glycosyltransferase involved in cell wall biosynthesis
MTTNIQAETLKDGSISCWMRLWDEAAGGFRFATHQPPTLMATAYAVLGLEFTGGLARLTHDQETAIISFLMEGVQPDGSFADPMFHMADVLTGEHDAAYFREEMAAFCQQALDALAAPPPPPRRWHPDWLTAAGLVRTFESFPWRNAWLDSNRVMFILSQLCHDAERHREPELLALVDSAIDWLDAHQSPKTGLWQGPHPVTLENSMAATFHFTFYYCYRRRPLRYVERIIDSCLRLQQRHGLFSGSGLGHTCLDYDALDLLAKASLATDYRRDDVCAALRRAAMALLSLHNEDGGFAHCKKQPALFFGERTGRLFQLSGLSGIIPNVRAQGEYSVCQRLLSCPTGSSNVFSTWFRLLALTLSEQDQWLQSEEPLRLTFRRLPFLGYHDPLAIQSGHGVTATAPTSCDPEWQPKRNCSKQSSNPLISVVIPAYNAGGYLDSTLSSLRAQTYPRWEAIVVNDGSSDATGEIAHRWARADSRIRVVEQINKGLGAARNAALAHAEGELIHCLDADDLIEPDFYESILSVLQMERKHDSPGTCAFSSVRFFRGSGQIISARKAVPAYRFSFGELSRENPGEPVCYVFERRILRTTGVFDENLLHCHDWDLWLRFSRIGVKFVPVEAARAWYRVASHSLSTTYVRFMDAGARVLSRTAADESRCTGAPVVAEPVSSKHMLSAVINFWYYNLWRALSTGSHAAAQELFRWARRSFPPDFWVDPDSLDFRPVFFWTGSPPSPGRIIETRWKRTLLMIALWGRFWPELPDYAIRLIHGNLARETVLLMSQRGERLALGDYATMLRKAFSSTGLRAWRWRDLAMVLSVALVPRLFLDFALKIRPILDQLRTSLSSDPSDARCEIRETGTVD